VIEPPKRTPGTTYLQVSSGRVFHVCSEGDVVIITDKNTGKEYRYYYLAPLDPELPEFMKSIIKLAADKEIRVRPLPK
jgi:hypothetical protein